MADAEADLVPFITVVELLAEHATLLQVPIDCFVARESCLPHVLMFVVQTGWFVDLFTTADSIGDELLTRGSFSQRPFSFMILPSGLG